MLPVAVKGACTNATKHLIAVSCMLAHFVEEFVSKRAVADVSALFALFGGHGTMPGTASGCRVNMHLAAPLSQPRHLL